MFNTDMAVVCDTCIKKLQDSEPQELDQLNLLIKFYDKKYFQMADKLYLNWNPSDSHERISLIYNSEYWFSEEVDFEALYKRDFEKCLKEISNAQNSNSSAEGNKNIPQKQERKRKNVGKLLKKISKTSKSKKRRQFNSKSFFQIFKFFSFQDLQLKL